MKLTSMLIALIVIFGCESERMKPSAPEPQTKPSQPPSYKKLDWNKPANEQNLKIGDTITVEGIAYNIFPYDYHKRFWLM